MLKIIMFIIALSASFSSAALAAPQDDQVSHIQREIIAPTFALLDDGRPVCSGTFIYSQRDAKSGEVETIGLTAKHCVADLPAGKAVTIEVPTYDKALRFVRAAQYITDVAGKSSVSDVAILKLRDKATLIETIGKLEKGDAALLSGEPTYLYGYALGARSPTLTGGYLGERFDLNVGGTDGIREYFRASPAIFGGNSGGGLFHLSSDGSYKLIGIATGYVPSFFVTGLYTPIDQIEAYLKVAVPQVYAGH